MFSSVQYLSSPIYAWRKMARLAGDLLRAVRLALTTRLAKRSPAAVRVKVAATPAPIPVPHLVPPSTGPALLNRRTSWGPVLALLCYTSACTQHICASQPELVLCSSPIGDMSVTGPEPGKPVLTVLTKRISKEMGGSLQVQISNLGNDSVVPTVTLGTAPNTSLPLILSIDGSERYSVMVQSTDIANISPGEIPLKVNVGALSLNGIIHLYRKVIIPGTSVSAPVAAGESVVSVGVSRAGNIFAFVMTGTNHEFRQFNYATGVLGAGSTTPPGLTGTFPPSRPTMNRNRMIQTARSDIMGMPNFSLQNCLYPDFNCPPPPNMQQVRAMTVSGTAVDVNDQLFSVIGDNQARAYRLNLSATNQADIFQSAMLGGTMSQSATLVGVGDLDCDNKSDVLLWDNTALKGLIYSQDTNGNLNLGQTMSDNLTSRLGTTAIDTLVIEDFDSDKLMDIAIARGGNVILYTNSCEGGFTLETTQNLLTPKARAMASGDINGDSKTDLVVIQDSTPQRVVGILLQ